MFNALTSQVSRDILLLWIVSALLTGCFSNPINTAKQRKLEDTLRLYEATVRWGELDRMYGFLRPQDRQKVEIPSSLANVRVTSYEGALAPTPIAEYRYQHAAVIQYVLQDRQVIRTITDSQIWELDPDSDNWYRVNPIPPFD